MCVRYLFSCSFMSNSVNTWTAARQDSLSFTISRSLLRLTSIESVMPSNRLILSCPLLPSIFPSIKVFASGGQSVGASASASVLPINIQDLFPLGLTWRRQWHPTPVLLPGKSHGQRSLVGCSPWGRGESDMTERLHFHFSPSCIREGNGNPLQCSCLENPRDGGAWWAAVYGVAQSRTRLK